MRMRIIMHASDNGRWHLQNTIDKLSNYSVQARAKRPHLRAGVQPILSTKVLMLQY